MSTTNNGEQNKKVKNEYSFTLTLNWIALIILFAVISVFIYSAFNFINRIVPEKKSSNISVNFKLNEVQLKTPDTTLIKANKIFIDSLNNKVEQLKVQIKTLNESKEYIEYIQNRNENDFRLLLIILGSVFAIVGFFGFKSINDVRENSIKNAKDEALKIAEKETERIATREAVIVATNTAKITSEQETIKYLEENKGELFTSFESNITNTFQPQLEEIMDRIDKVQNPFSFHENDRPQVFNQLENNINELKTDLKKIQDDFLNFQKTHFMEVLKNEIIKEIKQ